LKTVCYKVTLCKNCQRQSFKAFIGLSIRAKMIGGDIYTLLRELTHPLKKRFSICFARSASISRNSYSEKVQLTLLE